MLSNEKLRQALLRAQQRQRILIVQLMRSMKAAERMKKIEIAMKKQTAVLDLLQEEKKKGDGEDFSLTEAKDNKKLTSAERKAAKAAALAAKGPIKDAYHVRKH